MGVLSDQQPVKLVVSIIYREAVSLDRTVKMLKGLYGKIEPLEKTFSFNYTDYYEKELGKPLYRKILCFKKLVRKERLYNVKISTNRIEELLRSGANRTVNVDPGYLTEAKLVLLTTKDYTHRIYIGKRIFAESTLFFKNGTFNPWPWTYPDYASREMISYFTAVRPLYMEDLRSLRSRPFFFTCHPGISRSEISGIT